MYSLVRLFLLFPLALFVIACNDEHPTARYEKQKSDDWQSVSPESLGVDPTPLNTMKKAIRDGRYFGISSIVLAYQGQLILEHYPSDCGPDDLHTMRSASKAITSALVGIAIDRGFVDGVEAPILDYFPEYDGKIENWDQRKRDIAIHHLLSMTSGVKGNEDAMYPTNDWIKFYLDQPLANAPGDKFSYATSGVVTLGNIVTRASGLRIPEFANRYLFEPMNIRSYKWPITNSLGNQGLAMTGGGLQLTPRDMAKFGQLFLQKGVWNGQQLISSDFVELSTKHHATSDLYGESFGYLWRIMNREQGNTLIQSYEAWGNGGQFIMVFPTLDLVAVFTGENYGKLPEMEQPFELLDTFIIPAILKSPAD